MTLHGSFWYNCHMHEMSITEGIVRICEEHAGGSRVSAVVVEIGRLSGVVPEAVEFCFEACTAGTLLEGARLEIVTVEPRGRCRGCGSEFPVSSFVDPCPTCGAYGIEIIAGEELRVKELEVE